MSLQAGVMCDGCLQPAKRYEANVPLRAGGTFEVSPIGMNGYLPRAEEFRWNRLMNSIRVETDRATIGGQLNSD